ncbi:MAG TPA: serine/threonine-protein kinase [Ktedonobacteraceae bacterium]|nr:serine/threonine-protein kinase [Ktedonobacteraceae bacterium]
MLTLEGMQLGNYDVVRRIRVGGMGAVYEGRQRSAFGRRVAIKVILGSYAADREMRRRFAREARTIAELHHPHILQLIEFGDEQGILYLVMPFIEGGTLTGYLRRSLPDFNEVATIFLQLLDAVEYAHDQGLIHRDIKSSNVLLEARRDGPPYIYLADFGLVRYSEQNEREQAGKPIPLDQIPGTPHYMAPEQTRGIITTATDIYALGVLLYQMLVGELPYDDPDDVEVVKMHLYAPVPSPCDRDASIPRDLGEVVRKAMAKRVEARFSNVAEMRQAFLAAIERPMNAIEDDRELAEIDEFMAATPPKRPISAPLSPMEIREVVPGSGLIQPGVKQTTNRYVSHNRKRFTLSLVATTLVSLTLLVLLLMPRVFNFSIFPTGFPLFGTAPYATISVVVQSKTIQDTYLLTASPQISKPNITTRKIPDRSIMSTATASRTVASSGIQPIPGVQASGSVLFDNSSRTAYSVPAGIVFTTDAGVEVKLMQSIVVPRRTDGQDGTISALAVAVFPGVTGNIGANVLNTMCCNSQLTVSNPQPFSGGLDPHVVHIVTQADIDNVKNALLTQLQRQALSQLQKQLTTNEVEAGQPTYITRVVSDNAPGTQVDGVNVQVSVSATTYVFNLTTARLVAVQLLNKQAVSQLDRNYILKDVLTIGNPVVVQQGQMGIIYLSISARGSWIHTFSSQQIGQWQQSIKGATPMLAKTYLDTQPGVVNVQIRLPFGADHLPASVDQIKIVLINE